jgi:hypothetical protein
MRRLTSLEKTLVLCALVFIGGGVSGLVRPQEFTTLINAQGVTNPIGDAVYLHKFSRTQCRICGALCVGCGVALVGMAFYPWARRL